MEQC